MKNKNSYNILNTNIYIDASNLFYGGVKSLGWSIDYQKLYQYLKEKYSAAEIYFFGGVEIHNFHFDYLVCDSVNIKDLEKYLLKLIEDSSACSDLAKFKLLARHLRRVRFYLTIERFGYKMILKPVKTFFDAKNLPIRKANCDVDMAFFLM